MNAQIGKWVKIRIVIILVLFYGLTLTILARAYQFQVLQSGNLRRKADQQYHHLVEVPARRGVIFDREGRELAVSRQTFAVCARPDQVLNPSAAAGRLAKVLNRNSRDLLKVLSSSDPFVWVDRQITPAAAEQVRLLNLKGIELVPGSRRYYPGGSLAAHVVGFAGVDSQGLGGIEYAYQDLLQGQSRYLITERDALGELIFPLGEGLEQENRGTDLVLTLDKSLQFIAERELRQAVTANRAKGGSVVGMDPRSGEILFMAVEPGYDPNDYTQFPTENYRNRAVVDLFEPGSTFKVFLAGAVLEEGVARPSDVYFCENGAYTIYDKVINDYEPHGDLTVRQIISLSSNIGASKLGQKLGKERLYQYITRFGFGSRTGVDFPGERSGVVNPPKSWSPVGVGTISFGQGISVTALQMVTALSAVANGGVLMKPYLAKRAVRPDGAEVVLHRPERVARVLSAGTIKDLTSILESVVQGDGTGKRAALEGYRVAGKTGTAQKKVKGIRGYAPGKYVCSFMGFLPAEDPRLAIIVVIDEPETDYPTGGMLAAPVFREIARQAMVQLKVPRSDGAEPAIARSEADLEQPEPVPPAGGINSERELLSNPASPASRVMPDLSGQSFRPALLRLAGLGIPIQVEGSGRVVAQEPPAGSSLAECTRVVVRLQP